MTCRWSLEPQPAFFLILPEEMQVMIDAYKPAPFIAQEMDPGCYSKSAFLSQSGPANS